MTDPASPLVLHTGDRPPVWAPARASLRALDAGEEAWHVDGADLALIDAATTDALAAARRLRAADAALHIIIVAPPARQQELERALLFTPGVGEVWIVPPDRIDEAILRRGSEITRTRRSYRATRAHVDAALSAVATREGPRHSYITDAYLAALLQVLPDPVLSLGDDDRVASWSPATEETLGADRARLHHAVLRDVVRPTEPEILDRLLERGRLGTEAGELGWVRGDGEERIAEVVVTPVDAAGQRVRAVLFRDVTEERAVQQRLEEQATELEAQAEELIVQRDELATQRDSLGRLAAERMKLLDELRATAASRSRFYASMSHEIRTPINAILGYNDLLLTGVYGELAPDQRQGIERAQAAARHLRELVNDVLDLSKIESGKLTIVAEPVELASLVREVVATIGPLSAQHGSAITCGLVEPLDAQTDPRRVRQILLNLLSNAVKFGAGKPVHVRLDRFGEDRALIEVQDRGSGIGPERIDQVFEEFVQLDTGSDEGTGLGLAISRRLAAALGGSLAVASTPGLGSTFSLVFPLSRPTRSGAE